MNHAYLRLSRFRSELMGLAILWVMLFHAYEFHFNCLPLDAWKATGFAGVDVFILLSAMGLYVSLGKTLERERERAFPDSSCGVLSASCRLTGWWWGCIACG